MKISLFLAVFALAGAACKKSAAPAAAVPAAEAPADQNRVEKYVGGMQADVTRAKDVQENADAANKRLEDAQKEAEGQ